MGLGGISIWQLLIILLIVVFIFGTKRLRGMGSDLGGALKGFKKALNDDEQKTDAPTSSVARVENPKAEVADSKIDTSAPTMAKTPEKPTSASTSDPS